VNLVVTCGDRIDAKFGFRVGLQGDGGLVEQLRCFLAEVAPRHIWWAPFEWRGNQRQGENWLSACGLCIDVDYHDDKGKHVAMPQVVAPAVLRLIEQDAFPGNIAHLTPRGFRLVVVFADGVVTDRAAVVAASQGFAAQVHQALVACGVHASEASAGFRVDQKVVGDLARYLFLANTQRSIRTEEPEPRRSRIFVLRSHPIEVAALAQHVPPPNDAPATASATPKDGDFVPAAERWARDHPIEYPRSGGTCPICKHNDCFGQLKDDRSRWACFSSDHETAAGHRGTERQNCWIGSSLDIEAHRRGCTRRDVLIEDAYLADRSGDRAGSPQSSNHTVAIPSTTTAQPNDTRKRIRYEPKNLGRAVDVIEAILAAEPKPIVFQSAGQLVRIVDDALLGQAPRPVAKRISAAEAKAIISDRVVFQRFRGKKPIDLGVPDDVVKALVAKTGWNLIPKLTGIAMVPVMRADGSIHDQGGYDLQTGYFTMLTILAALPVPAKPTLEEARVAAQWIIDEVFGNFPFKQPHDKAAVLAELLTGLLRPTISGAVPAFLHLAPLRGTGKTLLAQLVALTLLGEKAPVTQPPTDEAEWRKLLFAAALGGQPVLFFDNVPAGSTLKSSTLDMALTADAIRDRHLGHTKEGTAALRSLILFTGNNVRLGGDLPRRVVPIVLDSNEDRPERRSGFDHDPIEPWVLAHRGEILARLFTIARAYRQAFPPGGKAHESGLPRFGGFEAWDQGIRGMVRWLGLSDAAGGVDALHDVADDDTMERAELLEVLNAVFGDREFTSADVLATAGKGENDPILTDGNGRPMLTKEARLYQAIRQEGRRLSVNKITRTLGEHVDAPADGLVLRGTTHSSKKAGWLVAVWIGGDESSRSSGDPGVSDTTF
jgi:hypothetical protein